MHESFEGDIEPDLFSALLTAISLSQGGRAASEKIQTEVFEVDEYVATMCYGRYLAGIAIADKPTDSGTMSRLMKFVTTFEDEHEFILRNWYGDRTFFDQDWAIRELRENIQSKSTTYRLNIRAMKMTENARQMRVILLIRRFADADTFSIDTLSGLLVRELIISEELAQEYVSELEVRGILIQLSA